MCSSDLLGSPYYDIFVGTSVVYNFVGTGEDLTDNSDGGIMRSMKTAGTGYMHPNERATVKGLLYLPFSLSLMVSFKSVMFMCS